MIRRTHAAANSAIMKADRASALPALAPFHPHEPQRSTAWTDPDPGILMTPMPLSDCASDRSGWRVDTELLEIVWDRRIVDGAEECSRKSAGYCIYKGPYYLHSVLKDVCSIHLAKGSCCLERFPEASLCPSGRLRLGGVKQDVGVWFFGFLTFSPFFRKQTSRHTNSHTEPDLRTLSRSALAFAVTPFRIH